MEGGVISTFRTIRIVAKRCDS